MTFGAQKDKENYLGNLFCYLAYLLPKLCACLSFKECWLVFGLHEINLFFCPGPFQNFLINI